MRVRGDHNLWAALVGGVVGIPLGACSARLVEFFVDRSLTWPQRSTLLIATMVGCGLTGWRFGAHLLVVPYLVVTFGLITQTAIDAAVHRLPRQLSWSCTLVSLVAMVAIAVWSKSYRHLIEGLIGAVVATALLGIMYLASRGSLGEGDVRLAPLLGLHLGYLGLGDVVAGLFLGTVYGALFGIALVLVGKARGSTEFAYGPFLAAGTLTVIWWGNPLSGLVG